VKYIVVAAAFVCPGAAQTRADEIDRYFECAMLPVRATCAQYQRALYCAHMTMVLMYRGIHNDEYPNPDKTLEAMQNVLDGAKQYEIGAAKQVEGGPHVCPPPIDFRCPITQRACEALTSKPLPRCLLC
jgi:hypothetical protein